MSASIGNTCPDINNLIGSIKEAHGYLETLSEKLQEIASKENINLIEDAINILYPLFQPRYNPLEDLRDANSELRNYGEKWEDKANDLEYELEKANDKIAELENDILNIESNSINS